MERVKLGEFRRIVAECPSSVVLLSPVQFVSVHACISIWEYALDNSHWDLIGRPRYFLLEDKGMGINAFLVPRQFQSLVALALLFGRVYPYSGHAEIWSNKNERFIALIGDDVDISEQKGAHCVEDVLEFKGCWFVKPKCSCIMCTKGIQGDLPTLQHQLAINIPVGRSAAKAIDDCLDSGRSDEAALFEGELVLFRKLDKMGCFDNPSDKPFDTSWIKLDLLREANQASSSVHDVDDQQLPTQTFADKA